MEEEEEDRFLLTSLGVTSANIEDIERNFLSQAKNDSKNSIQSGDGSSAGQEEDRILENDKSSKSQIKLLNKLRAIELEIQAVSSSIRTEDDADNAQIQEGKTVNSLQNALASDRLKSLETAKSQIEREISKFEEEGAGLISKLVEEEPKSKKKLKKVEESSKNGKIKLRTVSYDEDTDFDAVLDAASGSFMETEREELVRKGILTPFHRLKGFEKRVQSRHQDGEGMSGGHESESIARMAKSMAEIARARPTTRLVDPDSLPALDAPTVPFHRLKTPLKRLDLDEREEREGNKRKKGGRRRPLPDKKWRKREKLLDESDEDIEEDRVQSDTNEDGEEQEAGEENLETDVSDPPAVTLEGGLKIPGNIHANLFEYQRVGVQWLWELHCQRAGGIIGDEMGLGKTIQVLAFLGSLHYSNLYKPSIIVCPMTLLKQWQREAKKWYPKFRVAILHDSARGHNSKQQSDSDSDSESENEKEKGSRRRNNKRWDGLINRVLNSGSGLLVTTYEQLRLLGEKLLEIEWGYAVLDEGHRIRNPNAEITLICKQLQTVHRVIMTGAPIQNKLSELWSLFDFVFPGKLGVLPVFESEFSVPITVGGYANATPLQVSTAYRCAVVLRDLIMPYILRRMKADVDVQLPKKVEHVLFCSLTSQQRSVYRAFLASSEVEQIFDGNRNSLYGIDVLRKICNHPDLLEREHGRWDPDYGNIERSGKLKVVDRVLRVWKEQGHRVLLFAQTQQMLDIIEKYLESSGFVYRRLDGITPAKQRMELIDEFNNSEDVFVFILTTRVGGLGTNLTGADRVIIYDPDWNPSTDMQARERAWRIGQKRDVTIYRLITRGTIEEKVYHRQIYKQFLTNKVLKNPQQRRFFKARDMRDLFTLQDDFTNTETSDIFAQLSDALNVGVQRENLPENRNKGKEFVVADEERESGNPAADHGETDILKSLFDAHGIHSAMNHDAIMNANEEERVRAEEEACRVAQRAAEALRGSHMLRGRDSYAVPTWTGRSGTAGAPLSVRSRSKFGSTLNSHLISNNNNNNNSNNSMNIGAGTSNGRALSSSELLSRIRGNQVSAVTVGSVGSSSRNQNQVVQQPELLIRQLCTFIQNKGGSVDSASITQHFKERIQSKDLVLFKSLLKEIATLERAGNNGSATTSKWVLKPDYRQ